MTHVYIDGAWRDAQVGGRREIINPFDQSVVDTVADCASSDVAAAVEAARRAFDGGAWPRRAPADRGRILTEIAAALEADREALARTETLDTGKTLAESRIDVDDVAAVFRYYGGLADKLGGERVATASEVHSVIEREPIGVCAQISPWNYPLLQTCWKVAPALAAGNTLVVKPSELTPLSTIRLFSLLDDVGVPAGVANLVLGAGPDVGGSMVRHPQVDMVSFTGGIATGRRIMASAAETVKNVALELGGKNPNVVFADSDFDTAVDYALLAVFLHSGQVCSAGSRLVVEESIHDDFVGAIADRARRIRLGNGMDADTESGPLISEPHRRDVEGFVDRARGEVQVVCGARRPDAAHLADGFFYEPTVLTGCRSDMEIVQAEVFGPVLTVETFASDDEAVGIANDTTYGLAAGVWTTDAGRAQRVARALRHGTVWINDFHPYIPQAPWGGFKQSGVGRELGPDGLAEYTETKHVFHNLRPEPSGWFKG